MAGSLIERRENEREMSARILFGGLFHETHTFLDQLTTWPDFEVTCDAAILDKLGDASPTDGFLTVARQLGFTVIPTIDIRTTPGGMVADEVFDTFWGEFAPRARAALAEGVDAIFLVLHGAMVTPLFPDVEGELLERIRALPGAADLPLFGVFDLHANFSARMGRLANGLVAYRENPHTDSRDSAMRATRLMARALAERVSPRMTTVRLPILWPPPGTGTAADPMRALRTEIEEIVAAEPIIWAGNVVAGFSFADTPYTGVSLSLIHTGSEQLAREKLAPVAALAWAKRAEGGVSYPSVDAVMSRLPRDPGGPIVLVEPADNIGGGAPGDGTGILRALLRHGVDNALVAINDAEAVCALQSLPLQGTIRLAIGGKGSALDAGPLDLEVTLISRSAGTFDLEDRHSHLASMRGLKIEMGPCAVVRTAGVTLLLTSRKTPPFDLGQFRSQGLEPGDFKVIGVKAAVAHRRAYDPIAGATFLVDTPGPCRSDVSTFPWQQLPRPIFPLDDITTPKFEFL